MIKLSREEYDKLYDELQSQKRRIDGLEQTIYLINKIASANPPDRWLIEITQKLLEEDEHTNKTA